MFALALTFVFFAKPISRGAVLFNKFILRRDISDQQTAIARKLLFIGILYFVLFTAQLLYGLCAR